MLLDILLRPTKLAPVIVACGLSVNVIEAHGQGLPLVRNTPFATPLSHTAIDPRGRFVFGGSHDMTVKVWDLETLRWRDTFRVPIRPRQRKRAHATAISPNGETIAFGVPPERDSKGHQIPGTARVYILQSENGARQQFLKIPTRSLALRFSPDGKFLAASLSAGCGLRVWKWSDRAKAWQAFGKGDDVGYSNVAGEPTLCCPNMMRNRCEELGKTPGLMFFPKREKKLWLATAGETGIRVYERSDDGFKVVQRIADEGKGGCGRPFCHTYSSLALSPAERHLAVGQRAASFSGAGQKPKEFGQDKFQVELFAIDRDALDKPEAAGGVRNVLVHKAALRPPDAVWKRHVKNSQAYLGSVAWLKHDGHARLYAGGAIFCRYLPRNSSEFNGFRPRNQSCAMWWEFPDNAEDADPWPAPKTVNYFRVGAGLLDFHPLNALKGDLNKVPGLVVSTMLEIGVYGLDGKIKRRIAGRRWQARLRSIDFRGPNTFKISDDGMSVEFDPFDQQKGDATNFRFNFNPRGLITNPKSDTRLMPRNRTSISGNGGSKRNKWRNKRPHHTLFSGRSFPAKELDPRDLVRDVDVEKNSQGEQRVIWGSSNFLHLVAPEAIGPKILCKLPIAAEAYRVQLTPGARMAIVGHGDGILRWYGVDERRLRRGDKNCLTLLLSVLIYQSEEPGEPWTWLAWRPDCMYDVDPDHSGTSKLIGELKTVGNNSIFTPLQSGFRNLYSGKVISDTLKAPAKSIGELRNPTCRLKSSPYSIEVSGEPTRPTSAIINPVTIRYQWFERGLVGTPFVIRARIGRAFAQLRTINDPHFASARAGLRLPATGVDANDIATIDLEVKIPESALPSQKERQSKPLPLVIEARIPGTSHWYERVSTSKMRFIWTGSRRIVPAGRLHAVVVGVSNYGATAIDLDFAQNDALDFAKLLLNDAKSGQTLFASTKIDLFLAAKSGSEAAKRSRAIARGSNGVLTLHDVKAGSVMDRLKKIGETFDDSPDNTLVVFFSGHGQSEEIKTTVGNTENETYLLLPGQTADFAKLKKSALRGETLRQRLNEINANKIVILDACRDFPKRSPLSEHITNGTLDDIARSFVFFSSAAGFKTPDKAGVAFSSLHRSLYASPWPKKEAGNSLYSLAFLASLVDGDSDGSGIIEIEDINLYVDNFFNPKSSPSFKKFLRNNPQVADIVPKTGGCIGSGDCLKRRFQLRLLPKSQP
ncbi:MAG: caspase family protein [Pseudomonadota bacterium]